MNKLSSKIVFCISLMIFGHQTVLADNRPHSHRERPAKHWQKAHAPHHSQAEHRFDRHRETPAPFYRHYYKPGYRVNPLPHRHSRIFVNADEYYFFDGFFYRPSPGGHVIVEAPIGAIVAELPRLHHLFHWHGEPYYVVDNTFYRRHPRGYIVVPDPGYGYRP